MGSEQHEFAEVMKQVDRGDRRHRQGWPHRQQKDRQQDGAEPKPGQERKGGGKRRACGNEQKCAQKSGMGRGGLPLSQVAEKLVVNGGRQFADVPLFLVDIGDILLECDEAEQFP
jgi:hypothetical protein